MTETREEREAEDRQREESAGFTDRILQSSLRSTHTSQQQTVTLGNNTRLLSL
jgi:hypothetical protein